MKKLMALCLAMLMALSMCSFTVMAEDEAPALAATFEDIANGQPAKFVTSNLVLGENDVITSSDEAVIALDGTVTRPIYEDATVTLTINGGEAVEVTVKSRKTNVLYSNDFAAGLTPEWVLDTPTGNTASSVIDGAFHVIIGATSVARTWNYYYPKAISGTKPVSFTFNMSNITDLASAGTDMRISGVRYNAEGTAIGSFSTITVARCNTTSGYGTYWFGSSKKTVTLKYDPATGDFWGNGTKSSKNLATCTETNFVIKNGYTTDDVAKVVITSIGFTNAAGGCTATFDMDNFVQFEELTDEEAFAVATPAEKLAHYKGYLEEEYVANGNSLDGLAGNLRFTADAALPEGASLVWTSSNDAIAADGTVKRHVTETKTATITGTLTIDGESISKSYNVKILPITLTGQSEVVDFDSYALSDGAAVAGTTGWPTSVRSGVSFTNVVDGDNSYATVNVTDNSFTSSNIIAYTFQNAPQATGRYYVLEYDYRTNTAIAGGVTGLAFMINGTESAKINNRSGSYGLHPYKWRSGDVWFGDSNGTVKINATDFVNLKTVIDTQENTISYYADGVHKYSEPRYGGADLSNITSVNLQLNWRSSTGSFSIDNIKVYSENTLESILPSLADSDKVDYFKSLVEKSSIGSATSIGTVLDLDNGYDDIAPATYGVAINWASDNTEYIANDGTVNKLAAHGAAVTVNMTATITAGGASDTVTIAVPVANETALMKSTDYSDTSIAIKNADYVTDEDPAHGSVLHVVNPTAGTHKSTDTIGTHVGGRRGDRFIFSGDMRFVNGNEAAYGGFGIKTYAGSFGIGVYLNYGTNKVSVITTEAVANAAATGLEVKDSVTKYYQIPAPVLKKGEGAWVNITVDHNALSQTYYVYVDGILITEIPILQAMMNLGSNGGNAFRGYSVEVSNKGEIWVDNVKLYDYVDSNAEEVNAALNAALIDYASTYVHPVLTNCTLPANTIGRSWIKGDSYDRDLTDAGKIKATNVSTYKYVADGPAITWEVDGKPATEIKVTSPKTVTIKVTATKNGYSESKTFTRKVAPVAIRSLALGTASCLNGAWIEGADGTEKLIVACYQDGVLVSADVVALDEEGTWDPATGKGNRFNKDLGMVQNLGTSNPKESPDYDRVKLFVVAADGITPLAYANGELYE